MELKKLRSIKLRHLLAFVETVRSGSLKSGAERVHLTQSAISKTIKDLEGILGVTLLKRNRGGIELTREGEVFRQFAEQGLASVSHGVASLDALTAGRSSPVRIGALPSVAADFLPEVIQVFRDLAPSSNVLVEDGSVGSLIERLRSGELDLVIGRFGHPETMAGLSFTQLYSEQVVFAAAADHPQAQETDPSKLAETTILYPPPEAAIHPLVERFMISEGISSWPKVVETVSGPFGRAMTLGNTRAIWIISQGVVARDVAAGLMVTLPIDTSTTKGAVGVMARSEEDPTPAMRLFRQALLDVAKTYSTV